MTIPAGDATLVTGAGGFIGSAVVRALVARGAAVRAWLGPEGASVVEPPPGCESVRGSIEDRDLLRRVADVRSVVHLAGPPSVQASFRDPAGFARAHVVGTAALLEACAERGVERFVYVSSAEVYGAPEHNPVAEDATTRPRSPYAAAKLGAEAFVRAAAEQTKLTAIVLRPFSIYGPGASPHSLLATILRQARAGSDIVLQDLRPVRDYCYVDDLADAIQRALEVPLGAPAFRLYNVGTGIGTSVEALARTVLQVMGMQPRVLCGTPRTTTPRPTDILELVADTGLSARELGFRCTTRLLDGVERTLAHERKTPWRHGSC